MEYLKPFKLFESVTRYVFDDRVEYHNDGGQLHREDGPAIEYNDGGREWWVNNKRHREDGPAVECYGNKFWYLNGELHREDGPAAEYTNGDKYWYLNGKRHREDGPAVEYSNGNKFWYLRDINSPEYLFIKKLTNQKPNPNLFQDLPIEDLEELSADLCDKYIGEIKKWNNFYAIYFRETLNKQDPDLKSFENRIKDFRIKIGVKSILIY